MNHRQHFEHTGYLLLPGFFDAGWIAGLATIVERVFQQWLQANRTACIEQRLINMHSLTSPGYFVRRFAERIAFFNLIANERLVALARDLFGDDLYFHNTQLFFNPIGTERQPYWHRDLQYGPFDENQQQRLLPELLNLHARIPLLPERGLELIPGTHRRWDTPLERSVRLEAGGRRHFEDLPDGQCFDLRPGDLLIFHAHMLHRGNYALNQDRRGFDIALGAPHPQMTGLPDPAHLPEREELPFVRFPDWYSRARTLIAPH